MPKQKLPLTMEYVLECATQLTLEDQLSLSKKIAEIIAQQEKEAEQKLNLIRGGGK